MTRALITGAGGFVAHHLLEHLLVNTDDKIVLLDSFRHRGVTDRIREVLDSNIHERSRVAVFSHDLAAPISSVLEQEIGRVDVVYNLASESHVDRSIAEPRPFIENNVHLMLTMLAYARRVEPSVFIQVSTDEVYGPAPDDYRHREWDPVLPSNPYSASKAAQEAVCFAYWRTYGVPIVMTNTMNIVGERQDVEKFVPMVIRRVLDGEVVPIHGTEDAIGSRFYLHARNQADALLFLATRRYGALGAVPRYGDAGVDRPERYHIVGELEVDNLTMAQRVADTIGQPLRYELVDFHSTRPGHDLRYALDGTKLADAGWVPPVPLWASLERTVRWTLEHPAWLKETS